MMRCSRIKEVDNFLMALNTRPPSGKRELLHMRVTLIYPYKNFKKIEVI